MNVPISPNVAKWVGNDDVFVDTVTNVCVALLPKHEYEYDCPGCKPVNVTL
jgi:hypothetical protein